MGKRITAIHFASNKKPSQNEGNRQLTGIAPGLKSMTVIILNKEKSKKYKSQSLASKCMVGGKSLGIFKGENERIEGKL
mgnify:CR=1 FL=1